MQLKKAEQGIILALLSTWGWIGDYQKLGQWQRVGRLKTFLFASAAVVALRVGKEWHWSLGAFYLFAMGFSLHLGMPQSSYQEILIMTATLLLIPYIAKRVSTRVFENIVLATAAVHCAFGVPNMFGIYFPKLNVLPFGGNRPVGLLGQETILGPYLVFAVCLLIPRLFEGKKWRYLYGSLLALNVVMILLTKSAMTYLSLSAAGVAYAGYYEGLIGFSVATAMSAIAAIVVTGNVPDIGAFSGRLVPWADAITLIKKQPYLGYGPGSWSYAAKQIAELRFQAKLTTDPRPWTQLHNEPLQGIFEFGSIGMAFVAMFLAKLARSIKQAPVAYVAGFMAFAVNSLGSFPLHIVPHGPLMMYCAYQILKGEQLSA